jgi:hypothetical protein
MASSRRAIWVFRTRIWATNPATIAARISAAIGAAAAGAARSRLRSSAGGFPPVGVATAELVHASLAEVGSGLWGRVVSQERQGDLRGQLLEHPCGAWPVLGQHGPELVRCCGAGLDQCCAGTHQHAELSGGVGDRGYPAEAVAVGAGVVGEHESIPGVGLGARGPPARSRRVEPGRFGHQDRMTGCSDQPDDQALAALDGNRQVVRVGQLAQLLEELA